MCIVKPPVQVCVCHDLSLGRLCGSQGKGKSVSDFNHSQLPPLLPHNPAPPQPGQATQKSRTEAPSAGSNTETERPPQLDLHSDGTRIPLLSEVLEEFSTLPFQVDIKVRV